MKNSLCSRRQFVNLAVGCGVGTWLTSRGLADEPSRAIDGRPRVSKPRATSGDKVSEPNWDERLTITVGPKEADLVGTSQKVLQAAVDYVSRLGGRHGSDSAGNLFVTWIGSFAK